MVSTGGVSPEYYLKMYFNLNIPADEIQYPHTYPFKLQFSFKNNNVLMRSKTLPSKSGEIYKVNYKPSTNKLTFPNEVKNGQAGYTYFAFDAIFNEAPTYPSIENVTVTPDAGYAISPFNSTTTLDGKSKFEYKPAENKISFELCFVPTEQQKYTAQSFNISVSVKPTGVDPITGSTTLIYAPLEEDPEQEQEIESYIHDRSFSLMCYTEANGTYNVNYASA
ncbi:MAG: hypothetical protein MJ201_04370 [Mycoplasmoidaceae bacterium]|nr:hypothetical protein [Mycoplasmoidaceae bacterium]